MCCRGASPPGSVTGEDAAWGAVVWAGWAVVQVVRSTDGSGLSRGGAFVAPGLGFGGPDVVCGDDGGVDQDEAGSTALGGAGSGGVGRAGSGMTDSATVGWGGTYGERSGTDACDGGTGEAGCGAAGGAGCPAPGPAAAVASDAGDDGGSGGGAWGGGATCSVSATGDGRSCGDCPDAGCGAGVTLGWAKSVARTVSASAPAGLCVAAVLIPVGAVNDDAGVAVAGPSPHARGPPGQSALPTPELRTPELPTPGDGWEEEEDASATGAPTITMAIANGIAPGRPPRENRCPARISMSSCLILQTGRQKRPKGGSGRSYSSAK